MSNHSTTSQYGTLSRSRTLLNDEIRTKLRELLVRDIKEGGFVEEWTKEQAAGARRLAELKAAARQSPMSRAEANVIPLVQAAHSL
jgi:ketol-acid reductoisomerase